MVDFIIIIFAVIFVFIFIRRVVIDFKGNGNKSCSGCCSMCRAKNRCKDLKK